MAILFLVFPKVLVSFIRAFSKLLVPLLEEKWRIIVEFMAKKIECELIQKRFLVKKRKRKYSDEWASLLSRYYKI